MVEEGDSPQRFRAPTPRRDVELDPASPSTDIADAPTHEPPPATLEAPPTPTLETASRSTVAEDSAGASNEILEQTLTLVSKTRRIGHYELGDELGRGGMGVVYVAYDTTLDRKVAIKQLLGGRSGSRRRLVREALAMAKLSHPNVIPIHEIGERGDATYIVMEFVEGQTLRAWQQTQRTVDEVLEVYKAAARGLIAAHQKGLVHRDFKPDNVMIGTDGRVRVLDFGLASVASEALEHEDTDEDEDGFAASERSAFDPLTRTGALLGTPAYMSPERMSSEPAGAASDQFSFCVALYEALFDERPFAGRTFGALRRAVASGELREAPAGSTVPDWLREVVCRGLAVEPNDRFESMQALLDALIEGQLGENEAEDEREPPEYVFVVHDSRDKQKVLRLCEGLIDRGVRPWLDVWELGPGQGWRAPLELAKAPAVIVCGRSEDTDALATRIEDEPATVYAAHFAGSKTLGLGDHHAGAELEQARWDEGVRSLARLVGVDHEREGWLELEAARAGLEPAQLSPYRGLEAFREQDARWMFGRDEEVAALLELIRADQTRFLTLIGASGSGKSSLLMAGVCPMLRHGVLGDGVAWSIAYLRPGARPCEALANAIVNLDASDDAVEDGLKVKRLRAELLDGRDTLRLVLGRRRQGRVLLVLDQLEELFTEAGLGGDGGEDVADEGLAFVRNLLEATQELTGLDGNLWIAATLRADFVQRALEIPELARALQGGTYFALPPMSEAQIRAAVERPTARVGYRVEAKLVDKLVAAAAHQAGRLPLLQHVLRELWARRDEDRRVLSDAVYAETGGLEGAIAVAAERALEQLREQLGEAGELATRRLMTRLVHLGDRTSEDSRRRMGRGSIGDDANTQRVLEDLVRVARVLVATEVDGVETVEIAHEALLREWSTLVAWLDADREALRLRQQLAEDAAKGAAGHGEELLWGRGRIEEARRVLGASMVELNAVEREFLDASEQAVRRRRRGIQAGVAALLTAAMLVVAVVSRKNADLEVEKQRAEDQQELAANNEREQKGLRASMLAKIPGNELEALALAVGAFDVESDDVPAAVLSGLASALVGVDAGLPLSGHEDTIRDVAYSPEGTRLATASDDKTIRLWDAHSGSLLQTLSGHEDRVNAVVFSADGETLASASADKTVRTWDAATGKELARLEHEEVVFDVALSPDGARVATAGKDGVARVWELSTAEVLTSVSHDGPVRALSFSIDGAQVASASEDGSVRLWDAATGAALRSFDGHVGGVLALSLSTDGARLVSGGHDRTARLWQVATGTQLAVFEHAEIVRAVALSPDGARLAAGTLDGDAAHLWEVATTRRITSYRPGGPVFGVAFSPSGEQLTAVGWNGAGRTWDLARGWALALLDGHDDPVYAVAVSPGGARIATGSGDNCVRLWDAETSAPLAILHGHALDLEALAFSPDGQQLASVSWDGGVRLWDGVSGAFIRGFEGHVGRTRAVAFSPDGKQLASGGADERVRVWDTATGEARELEADAAVVAVMFSPDGEQLLAGTAASTARLWHTSTWSAQELGFEGPITAAAFSPDAALVALASQGHGVHLWDPEAGGTAVERFEGHTAPVVDVVFSPDGARLATASEDETARVWDVDTREELASFRHPGPVGDVAFSADGGRLVSASTDEFARVWDLDAQPWREWGCSVLDDRDAHTDLSQEACESTARVGPRHLVDAEPVVVDASAPGPELITVHGVELVLIPGGVFMMGSPEGEGNGDEHPQHEVELDSFYLARTEVTNAQYALYLEANPDAPKPADWQDERYNHPDQPVVGISWHEAKAYCDWAGLELPTEAQWEHAARAGTTTAYWFGDAGRDLDRFGWYLDNAGARNHAVANKGANPFGLHDVAGNVFEWIFDAYGYYTTSPRAGDGLRHEPVGEALRVFRGGSWYYHAGFSRSASRGGGEPGFRGVFVGFRPAQGIP